MKKLVLIITVAFVAVFSANAQVEKSEVITVTAKLNTTMALDLATDDIVFEFNTLDDYKNGLGGIEGDYASQGSVSSTSNWKLSYKANSAFTHADGITTMPLDNVGLTAVFSGSNSVQNATAEKALPLSADRTEIIGHDGVNSNAGDYEDNSFIIYWEMGTKNGEMNNKSLFQQDLKKGVYNTEVEFIASEVL